MLRFSRNPARPGSLPTSSYEIVRPGLLWAPTLVGESLRCRCPDLDRKFKLNQGISSCNPSIRRPRFFLRTMVHFVSPLTLILAVSVFIAQAVDPDQVPGAPLNSSLANTSVQSQLRGSSSVTSGETCIFKEFYFHGCTEGNDNDNGAVYCREGTPGFEGGNPSDYCYETGKKYCHKGYYCHRKHFLNQDGNCCKR